MMTDHRYFQSRGMIRGRLWQTRSPYPLEECPTVPMLRSESKPEKPTPIPVSNNTSQKDLLLSILHFYKKDGKGPGNRFLLSEINPDKNTRRQLQRLKTRTSRSWDLINFVFFWISSMTIQQGTQGPSDQQNWRRKVENLIRVRTKYILRVPKINMYHPS